jgi:hypothetical protein
MKLEFSLQIFENPANIKLRENAFNGIRVLPVRTDGQADRHDEANIQFFAIFQTPLESVHPVSYYYNKLEGGTRSQEVSGSNLGQGLVVPYLPRQRGRVHYKQLMWSHRMPGRNPSSVATKWTYFTTLYLASCIILTPFTLHLVLF